MTEAYFEKLVRQDYKYMQVHCEFLLIGLRIGREMVGILLCMKGARVRMVCGCVELHRFTAFISENKK